MAVVHVQVLVLEDGFEVGQETIGYYDGQDYVVKVDTPDRVDRQIVRKAGAAPNWTQQKAVAS